MARFEVLYRESEASPSFVVHGHGRYGPKGIDYAGGSVAQSENIEVLASGRKAGGNDSYGFAYSGGLIERRCLRMRQFVGYIKIRDVRIGIALNDPHGVSAHALLSGSVTHVQFALSAGFEPNERSEPSGNST